jgi:hypothetical protein
MKKYVVFMFCLMFAVSFVACGKKNDAARQPEDVKNDEESAGHPQDANSDDNSLDTLKDGDKVTVVSCTDDIGPNKCTIVLKFEFKSDKSSKEVIITKEVAIAQASESLEKVLQPVVDTNDGGKIHIAIGTDPSLGNAKTLYFYVFYNNDTPSCGSISPNYMGGKYIETGWKLGTPWILEEDVVVTIGSDTVKRKYSLAVC